MNLLKVFRKTMESKKVWEVAKRKKDMSKKNEKERVEELTMRIEAITRAPLNIVFTLFY